MPSNGGGCQYVLDPSDPGTWGGTEGDECRVDDAVLDGDGVWTCPHDVGVSDGRCVFHRPLEEKEETRVLDAFREALASRAGDDTAERERAKQFLGATFGRLDPNGIEENRVPGDLRLSHADIEGAVDLSAVTFEGRVSFAGATFRPGRAASDGAAEAAFERATFEGETSFEGATFDVPGGFRGATFEARTSFAGARSGKLLSFDRATFEEFSDFRGVAFKNNADFGFARFGGRASFDESTFADAAVSDGTYALEPAARFEGATFEAGASFWSSTFEVEADFKFVTFEQEARFTGSTFGAETDFMNATFGLDADFAMSTFAASTSFSAASFDGTADFSSMTLSDQRFDSADLTDADFTGATLHRTNFESALLSRATLFGADLRGARLSGAVMGDVRVDDGTRFLGRPSDDHGSPHTVSAIRASQPCVYDPAYGDDEYADTDTAKTVYRALEDIGRLTGRSRLQARCFVRRQDLQKSGYWADATAADATVEERVVAGARWGRSAVARAILLYGESPWRVIGYSVVTVVGFALLYPLGGWMRPEGGDPLTYGDITSLAEFGNSIYYSTLTFTALGFGDFQPVGFGRVLTAIETSLGAVLLAFLVFILGRRTAR